MYHSRTTSGSDTVQGLPVDKLDFIVSVQGMYHLKTVFSSMTAGKPV